MRTKGMVEARNFFTVPGLMALASLWAGTRSVSGGEQLERSARSLARTCRG